MGREGEAIVRVRAPAIDGRANEAVIAALADRLGVRRSQISLVRGATSRQKILVVEGLDAVQVRTRLQRPSAE